jgi:lipid-A-disaccharide synthase
MTHSTKHILVSAGEVSGDIHAANLITKLKELNPSLSFFGIGGKKMEEAGVDMVERMDKFSIVGAWEALIELGKIRKIYKKLTEKIEEAKPDTAILVDYPGFNLTLAGALKKRGVRVIYYITPQVWAWGTFRINLIKKYVDKALVILKFEEDLFKKHGIDAAFVGHPLLDRPPGEALDKKSLNLDEAKPTIALLPGSREREVKKILPLMLKTAELISREKKVQFVLLKSSGVGEKIYYDALKKTNLSVAAVKDNTYGCLSISDFVFVTSGTATLEGAIMEKPMLITYKISLFTEVLFRIFARTRWIGLVNIIAGREIVPEILQYSAKPKRLASEILSIMSSGEKMDKQVQELRQVKHALGTPGASLRAARIILTS